MSVRALGSRVTTKKLVFLPDWYMKLVRPGKKVADNVAVFHVPIKMTKFDIRNYLQDIYKVRVINVNTLIQLGKTKRNFRGVQVKAPDFKKAYVSLDTKFSFPETLFNPDVMSKGLLSNIETAETAPNYEKAEEFDDDEGEAPKTRRERRLLDRGGKK
eukprot:Colp12_sorted_trinity150504_noHs@34218